ncbi:MAG: hypothetical protein HQ564_09760 [Candidatus Saganbacteria bacterium]|nr:hypothetical protein [Candidatus Saganbacteria bacterium]
MILMLPLGKGLSAPNHAAKSVRTLFMGKRTFETALGEGQQVWRDIANYEGPGRDTFRVYINPHPDRLDAAVKIAKQVLSREDCPEAAFKFIESGFTRKFEGETKLVFYCDTAKDAMQITKIYMSHSSFNTLGPSKALMDTLPLNNLVMVSGSPREEVAKKGSGEMQRLHLLIIAFRAAGLSLKDGFLSLDQRPISSDPEVFARMFGLAV